MSKIATKIFGEKFLEKARVRGPFCLGIDPTEELLLKWGLSDDVSGLRKMCDTIIEAGGEALAIVKPQAAYFERFGPEGLRVLQSLVKSFHEQGSLVLLDAKRGDIGSTSLAYAKAYLGPKSPYQFDAMTATAYLGFGAIKPLLDYAAEVGAGVFVVTRSSNPEGEILQNAQVNKGAGQSLSVADHLAEQITDYNLQFSGQKMGPIGAVIGATLSDVRGTMSKLPHSLVLAPGIGFQGATFDQVLIRFKGFTEQLIPTSSRGVLSKGPDVISLRAEIQKSCRESMRLLTKV